MRGDDGTDLERADLPAASGPFDESGLDTPSCPVCLHRMEPAETRFGGVHWACPACGQRGLA